MGSVWSSQNSLVLWTTQKQPQKGIGQEIPCPWGMLRRLLLQGKHMPLAMCLPQTVCPDHQPGFFGHGSLHVGLPWQSPITGLLLTNPASETALELCQLTAKQIQGMCLPLALPSSSEPGQILFLEGQESGHALEQLQEEGMLWRLFLAQGTPSSLSGGSQLHPEQSISGSLPRTSGAHGLLCTRCGYLAS